jgi:hypothetical protein
MTSSGFALCVSDLMSVSPRPLYFGRMFSGAGAVTEEGAPVIATAVQMSMMSFRGHAPGAAVCAMSHSPEDGRVATGL